MSLFAKTNESVKRSRRASAPYGFMGSRPQRAGIHQNHLSRIARRSHADSRQRQQSCRYTLGRGDARPRISLVGLPVAQASDRAAADGALNACGDKRTESPDGEDLLGRTK